METKTNGQKARLAVFAPWWVYATGLALGGIALTLMVAQPDITDGLGRVIGGGCVLLLLVGLGMLAKATVWVGEKHVLVIRFFGLYWKKMALDDIQQVVYTPRESWGKLVAARLQISTNQWAAVDVPMGSVSASYACGRHIKARVEAHKAQLPAPGVEETGGRGWLLPQGLLPGWYRWRAPAVAVLLWVLLFLVFLA